MRSRGNPSSEQVEIFIGAVMVEILLLANVVYRF